MILSNHIVVSSCFSHYPFGRLNRPSGRLRLASLDDVLILFDL